MKRNRGFKSIPGLHSPFFWGTQEALNRAFWVSCPCRETGTLPRQKKLKGGGLRSLEMPKTDNGYHSGILATAGPDPRKSTQPGPNQKSLRWPCNKTVSPHPGEIPLLTRFQDRGLSVSKIFLGYLFCRNHETFLFLEEWIWGKNLEKVWPPPSWGRKPRLPSSHPGACLLN